MTFLRYFSRILWFVTFFWAAAVCIVHYVPFTYQQVVRGNLFPALRDATYWLPLAACVSLAALAISIHKTEKNKGIRRILDFVFLGLALFVPGAFGFASSYGLPNGFVSWILALASVLMMIAPGIYDLRATLLEKFAGSFAFLRPREKDFQLFITVALTALAISGFSYESENHNYALSLLSIGMVAMIFYAALTLLIRIAERSPSPLRAEWMYSGAFFGALCYLLFSGGIFPAVAYNGTDQKIFSAALACAFALFLMGLTPRALINSPDGPMTGLQLLLAPLTFRPRATLNLLVALSSIFAGAAILLSQAALMDWDFWSQKLILLAAAFLLFAQYQWFFPLRSPSRFHVTYPYLAGLVVLAAFVYLKESIIKAEPKNDVVFAMARGVLSSEDWTFNEDFYRFLQENSNIPKSVKIEPVEVRWAPPQREVTSGTKPADQRFNVIMIVVDSLRPDYLTPYNPAVQTTPMIDEFARDSIVFKRAFTRYGATGLSEPSIWVGGMMVHQQYITPFYPMNSLQKILEAEGYRMFLSLDSILTQIVKPGPNVVDLDPGVSTQDLDLCKTLPKLRAQMKDPFNTGPIFAYTQTQNIHISVLDHKAAKDDERFPGLYAPYAEALNRIDACFGQFVSQLKSDGLYENTIIVLTSDHGDSLGEEGRFGHAYTIFPEILRIPMIVRLPEKLKAQWEWDADRLAFSVDLTPSLYRLFGYPVAEKSWMFGRSLFHEKGAEKPRGISEPYLIASSYGAVYGLLENDGADLYIADAVNFADYSFDLRSNPPARRDISADERSRKSQIIRSRIEEINHFYGFKGKHGDN